MKRTWILAMMVLLCGAIQAQTTPMVVPTNATCATSVDGSVVGTLNPLYPPVVSSVYSGSLSSGTYYIQQAWYDASGNVTLVGPEVQKQLSGTGSLVINLPTQGKPATAVGMNVYIGTTSGGETLQGQTVGSAAFTQSTPLTSGTAEPSTNTTVCAIVANDAGWPTGTGYNVNMTTPAGASMPGYPMQWQLLGPGGTINLAQGLPYYNGTVQYPIPILSRPYNHASQSISGPLSMTGYGLTQVLNIGVGTSVPAWGVDVEGTGLNGLINANGGYLVNGNGGTTGQCLASGSSSYNGATAFNTAVNCITTLPTIYYQTWKFNGTAATQQTIANFSNRFSYSNGSGQTAVDLNAPGTGNYVATYASAPSTGTGCAQFDGNGNLAPISGNLPCALNVVMNNCLSVSCAGGATYGNNITYTNASNTPVVEEITMSFGGTTGTGGDATLKSTINGTPGPANGVYNQCVGVASVTFVVPVGDTFSVTAERVDGCTSGSATITSWLELSL